MPSIAFCEDNTEEQAAVKRLLDEFARSRGNGTTVACFASGEELLEALPARSFDLFLLDVVMPGMSGIDLAARLRESGHRAPIVFLTVTRDFAVESYLVHAADYLLKPVEKGRLFAALERALSLQPGSTGAPAGCFVVKCHEGIRKIPLGDIMCAELKGRAVRYALAGGEFVSSTTIRSSFRSAVEPLMQDARFTLCSASHLVNLQHVTAVARTDLTLADGSTVPLSRDHATAVKRRWMDYWLGHA